MQWNSWLLLAETAVEVAELIVSFGGFKLSSPTVIRGVRNIAYAATDSPRTTRTLRTCKRYNKKQRQLKKSRVKNGTLANEGAAKDMESILLLPAGTTALAVHSPFQSKKVLKTHTCSHHFASGRQLSS